MTTPTRKRQIIVWSGVVIYGAGLLTPYPLGPLLAILGIIVVLHGVSRHATLTTKETQ